MSTLIHAVAVATAAAAATKEEESIQEQLANTAQKQEEKEVK
jgi:hypothetical protein